MPKSHVCLPAGRHDMNEQTQALCLMVGANSIFYGEKLLTTGNPEADKDMALFANLGINPEKREEYSDAAVVEALVAQAVKQEESKLFYEAVFKIAFSVGRSNENLVLLCDSLEPILTSE